MSNVLAIVRRDIVRLLRVPAAWVVLFGLVFIPPLYAWFNIAGFWNPYGNTNGIEVIVVNNDRGTDSKAIGKMNMGAQIVRQLKGNHQLGWKFAGQRDAMQRVQSGESYASIIIPDNFSDRVAGVIEGRGARPTLEYYVNEKANALASRMTDTGASTVDSQVNETFVSTVSKVVSGIVNKTDADINAKADTATADTLADLDKAQQSVAQIRSDITDLTATLNDVPGKTRTARTILDKTQKAGAQTSRQLKGAADAIDNTQNTLNDWRNNADSTLNNSSNLLSQASSNANIAINSVAAGLTKANGDVGSALSTAQQINNDTNSLIGLLEEAGIPGSSSAIAGLQAQNKRLGDAINILNDLNSSENLGATTTNTVSAANGIDTATQSALGNAANARKTITTGALPQLNNGLNGLSTVAATSSANLASQGSLITQSSLVLNQVDQAAATAAKALAGTDKGLANLQQHLSTLTTDITALSSSSTLSGSGILAKSVGGDGKLDAAKIADFMLSPTVLDTKVVYPVTTYGSGMAPLFTNLTLWVGAFMLVVLMKLEVDDEGLEDEPTPGQRYWGRWILLALIATTQAIVTVLGELVIGVQCHNVPIFLITSMLASMVYVSITYALSTSFMHVGKALCVALVIVQIPGSSGMYPIEMMPKFFRDMYPYFPFTYSINALRETIAGFYHADWFINMGHLMIFAVLFFILGLAVKPHMGNLHSLVDRQLKASDIITNEPALHKTHEYRISQALSMLANKEEYRAGIEERARRFALLYPKLMRGALACGIAIPAAMAITFSLTTGTKVVALAAWVIWFLVTIIFLAAVESIRDSLARQVRLGNLEDDAVRSLLYVRQRPRKKAAARKHDGSSPDSRFDITATTTQPASLSSDSSIPVEATPRQQPAVSPATAENSEAETSQPDTLAFDTGDIETLKNELDNAANPRNDSQERNGQKGGDR
ncbi:YhgE/Pip domain-containing protein [Bifidobacterium sp. ESL0704]|uniref:YhgE/Pip domain-containing protein n=1 Tax=Bifidobacterium sp. ESL0704 TaxID=2983219 RepID=UPI0023F92D24|nr:YhgE/Pip domain-containing protein [Bifidobacterium sp. ESL0704]WEV53038.1 YhgE/Pip domain-containing protein [Bifidobacterium sp. ESL0704]